MTAGAAPVLCHTPTALSQQTTHNVTKPQSLSTAPITSPGSYQGITKLVSRVRYGVTFGQHVVLAVVHCSLLEFGKTKPLFNLYPAASCIELCQIWRKIHQIRFHVNLFSS